MVTDSFHSGDLITHNFRAPYQPMMLDVFREALALYGDIISISGAAVRRKARERSVLPRLWS